MIGTTLGHYQLDVQLGAGGMGVVHLAYDTRLRRQVAIKFLNSSTAGAGRAQLFAEARAASSLNHPNICTIYEVGEAENQAFIVMEYVPGTRLTALIPPGGLAPDLFRAYSLQIADAVGHAHAHGIVHRDLKSANIIVTANGRLKVLDFGLAYRLPTANGEESTRSASTALQPGTIVGTLAYIAPEVLKGAQADTKSDVWSIGVVLYEMATGAPPFDELNGLELALAITGDRPVPPLPAQFPAAQRVIIERCLERDALQRYETAGVLHAALEGAAPSVPRNGKGIAVAAAATLVAALGIGAAYWRWDGPRTSGDAAAPGNAVTSAAPLKARRAVAVLGFKNLSGRPAAAWMSTALSEMLTTELAAGEQLRTIPGENVARMKNDLSLADADSFAPDTLARIRSNIGSDIVVLGSYVAVGDKIRFDVRLQDADAGQTIAAVAEVGNEAQLLDVVSRIGRRLRDRLGVAELTAAEAATLQASFPASPAATRLYAEGLAKLRLFDAQAARVLLDQAVGSDPKLLLAHSALADAWAQLGYDERAKASARRAFELSSSLSREDRLLVEGRYHESINERSEAIKSYQTLYGFFPDNLDYGLSLARTQIAAGKGKDALETIDSLRRLKPPLSGDPRIDLAEASAAQSLSDLKRQQASAERAATKGQKQGARLLVALARLTEGTAWQDLAEPAKAIAAAEEARQIFASAGDRRGESRALRNVGVVLRSRGDLAGARLRYDDAVAISREIGDREGLAGGLNNIANVLRQAGSIDEARKAYAEALGIFREVGDQISVALILNNDAIALRQKGDLEGARRNYVEALAIRRASGEKAGIAATLNNLANVVSDEGRLAEATAMYEESLSLSQEIGDKRGMALAWFNMAEMVQQQGDPVRARALLDQALALRRAAEDKSGIARTLAAIGFNLTAQARLTDARKAYEEALAVQESIGEKREIARTRLGLARVTSYEGRPAEAELIARQSAEQFRRQSVSDDEATALALMSQALLDTKQLGAADEAIQRAVSLVQRSRSLMAGFDVSLMAARVQAAKGQHGAASTRLNQLMSDAKGFVEYQLQ